MARSGTCASLVPNGKSAEPRLKVVFVTLSEPHSPWSPPVAALSGAVRAAGHETAFLGFPLASAVRDAAQAIAAAKGDVIAVSFFSRDWPGVRSLLPQVKALTGKYIVAGGYHATLAPQDVASCSAVDAIGIGEGERALSRLLDTLAIGGTPSTFPGMWVRGPAGFTDPLPRGAPERDIATLPAWDYEVLGGIDHLLAAGVNIFGGKRDRFLPVRAGRGCPYDCTFCSAPRWGAAAGYDDEGVRNVKPVDALCAELARIRDAHRPAGYEFWDEHFPVDTNWLEEFSREYPVRVGLPFRAEMHPSAATRTRLERLAASGCVLFHCGVEAGDPEYRRRVLGRRPGNAVLLRVFDDARALGMTTSASVMVAGPEETTQQIAMTIELLRQLRPDHMFVSHYQPLPGTLLGDRATRRPPVDVERFDDFRRTPIIGDDRCLNSEDFEDLFRRFEDLKNELDNSAPATRS